MRQLTPRLVGGSRPTDDNWAHAELALRQKRLPFSAPLTLVVMAMVGVALAILVMGALR